MSQEHDKKARGLWSRPEAAQYIGMSTRYLEIGAMKGTGPRFVKISSKAVRYRQEDLDAWIAERLRTSTSDDGGNR